jgi:fructose-specific phosphotransferase system IIC component
MENYVSLMILLIVFMGLLLSVAYIADVVACKCLKYLGIEDNEKEQIKTPTIRFSKNERYDRYVEGDLFA